MSASTVALRAQQDEIIPFCHPDALDWSVIIFVFLAVSLSWWIFEIPAIWQHGWREFLTRAIWGALRVHAPGSVGILSLLRGRDPVHWPSFYYFGVQSPNNQVVELTRWHYAKIALFEVPVVVAAILCAYRWSIMRSVSGYQPSTGVWISGSIPSMVVGATLLLASRIRWKHISLVYISAFVALVTVASAYTLGIYFGSRQPEDAASSSDLVSLTCYYAVVMLPWLFFQHCWPLSVRIIISAAAVLLRSLGIVLAMGSLPGMRSRPGVDDHCSSNAKGLIFTFIPFGAIAFVLVIFGVRKFDNLRMANVSGLSGIALVRPSAPGQLTPSNIEDRPVSTAQDTVSQTETDTEALLPPPGPPPRYETYAPPPPYTLDHQPPPA